MSSSSLFSLIFGRRLASSEQQGQRIGVLAALPAMGLDGLSSSAYGPEAALTILIPLGAAGLAQIGPITIAILVLLAMLYFSYRQTIAAYPVNGGSYTVAKENLGTWAGLLAAAALMIDYILTVSVGISAGVGALVSALPQAHLYTLVMCLGFLAAITLLNLRGTAEAGVAFALPTYLFIVTMAIVLITGIVRVVLAGGHPSAVFNPAPLPAATESFGIWLLLRSFASGCTAMTGVEAVSNGVSAFKEPTVPNAHRTLTGIVIILAFLLGSIGFLAHAYHTGAMDQEKPGYQSVLSQLTAAIVGRGWFYKLTMTSVLAVLCLSANTSFVGFPRLCKLIAKDDFLPRSFAAIDRRLVYSVGVLFLAGSAGLLLTAFKGITDKLIPLYAVGAFTAFTLSQAGMVVHWMKQAKRASSYAKMAVNGTGAIATTASLAIILTAKFVDGAWITIVAIPALLVLFWVIHRHYRLMERQIHCPEPITFSTLDSPIVLVPMRQWNRPTRKSLRFGMLLSKDVVAIHLSNLEGDEANNESMRVRREWEEKVAGPARQAGLPVPRLDMMQTPYREFIEPLLQQIDRIQKESPERSVAVVIPEIVEKHWWESMLHTRRARHLRNVLRARKDFKVVVVELPWFIHD